MFTQEQAKKVEEFIDKNVTDKDRIYDILKHFSSLRKMDEYMCWYIDNEFYFGGSEQDKFGDVRNFRDFIWTDILKC